MKAKCDVIKQSFGGVYWKIKSIVACQYSLTQTNRENTAGLFFSGMSQQMLLRRFKDHHWESCVVLMHNMEGGGKKIINKVAQCDLPALVGN